MAPATGRGAATAARVENAALDLALEHGYDGVTVDMICQAAGVSQSTFFKYFPTKEDALLGRDAPAVDERAARRFIAANGPLLLDALALIQQPSTTDVPVRADDRRRVVAASPTLLMRQMERIAALESELREIITLRLERDNGDAASTAKEVAMVVHLLNGVSRFIATGDESTGDRTTDARTVLEQVLRDSLPH